MPPTLPGASSVIQDATSGYTTNTDLRKLWPDNTPTPQCLGRDHDRWRGGPGPASPAGPRPQPGAAVPDLVPRPPAPGKPGWPASPRARTGRTGGGSSLPHPSFLKTGPGGQQGYCSLPGLDRVGISFRYVGVLTKDAPGLRFPGSPPKLPGAVSPRGSPNVPAGGSLTFWECPFPVPLVLANLVDRALPRARPGRTGGGAPLPLRLPQGCLAGTLHPVLLTPGPSIRQCGSSGINNRGRALSSIHSRCPWPTRLATADLIEWTRQGGCRGTACKTSPPRYVYGQRG